MSVSHVPELIAENWDDDGDQGAGVDFVPDPKLFPPRKKRRPGIKSFETYEDHPGVEFKYVLSKMGGTLILAEGFVYRIRSESRCDKGKFFLVCKLSGGECRCSAQAILWKNLDKVVIVKNEHTCKQVQGGYKY